MTGLDLRGIHARYQGVLKIMKQRKCSLAKAMEKYGVARNTLRGFIGICELKIFDKDKSNTVVSTERERCGKPSVKDRATLPSCPVRVQGTVQTIQGRRQTSSFLSYRKLLHRKITKKLFRRLIDKEKLRV